LEILISSPYPNLKLQFGLNVTISIPVVLYRCATWSLTVRGDKRLRVFEKNALRRIFGLKKHRVTEH